MKSRRNEHSDPQVELFKVQLEQLVNSRHEMVILADKIDWQRFETCFSDLWHDSRGRPAIDTRLMVSMHYIKYTFDLSDEDVVEQWVQNPYWQYLSGMRYFQHELPLEPSSMSRWRGRVGQGGLEELLAQTIRCGLDINAIKKSQLKRVNVDTTVQEKHVRFPTDSRLYDRSRERLVKLADRLEMKLRQKYTRVGKQLLLRQNRYAHARQMKRAKAIQRQLRTILGRVIRDVERQIEKEAYVISDDADTLALEQLYSLLEIAKCIHAQERSDKNKVYSVHAPEVECISKGKAHKRYEFGVKVSIATSSKGGWHLGAMSLPNNPYDGHTLGECIEQVERLNPVSISHVFCDQGYKRRASFESQ